MVNGSLAKILIFGVEYTTIVYFLGLTMKNLFKKKGSSDKAQVSKKNKPMAFRFGKKKTDDGALEASSETKKGLVLNFGKKSTDKKTPKGDKAPLNAAKIIPVLVGVLVLILLALLAKMFVFNDAPAVDAPPAPAVAQPAPFANGEAEEPVQPAPVEQTAAEAQPESTPDETLGLPVQTKSDADPAQTAELTYDDFLQESNRRIYRERNTSGNETNP